MFRNIVSIQGKKHSQDISDMDLKELDPSEQETAVQLFREGLKGLSNDLIKITTQYNEVESYFRQVEQARNKIAEKYNRVVSLILKAGGEIDEQEASLANFESRESVSQAHLHIQNQPTRTDSSKPDTRQRPVIRNAVVEILRTSNKVQSAIAVLELIREKFGESIPDSTVTSALSVQWKAGILERVSVNGTSLYGLPEWFTDGKPKQEHYETRQMSI